MDSHNSLIKVNLVHVEQAHEPHGTLKSPDDLPSKRIGLPIFNLVAKSQFDVAQTIIKNPNALVVMEGILKPISKNDFRMPLEHKDDFDQKLIEKILAAFPKGFPKNYDLLTLEQQNWLVSRSGPLVLFALGLLDNIYPSDNLENQKATQKKLIEKKYYGFKTRFLSFFVDEVQFFPEFKKIICEDRELMALHLAIQAAKNSKDKSPLVLLVYGYDHHFGKMIAEHFATTINYQGRVRTTHFTDTLSSIEKILPTGKSIIPAKEFISIEEFNNILQRYKMNNSGWSFFDKTSSIVKKFQNLTADKLTKQIDRVTFWEILQIMTDTDSSMAKLFSEGLHPPVSELTHFDRILLELRSSFQTSEIVLDNEMRK